MSYFLLTKQSSYTKSKDLVNSISHSQLEHAAAEIRSTGKCSNPTILSFECQVQVVVGRASNSFAKYAEQTAYIKVLMVRNGMLIIWMMLNPNDLKSKLVLMLARVQYEIDSRATANIHAATVTMNPVAIAQFFSATCKGIFDHLLAFGTNDKGLFGPISMYFGTVEINGQGMLHLHCLVWLLGVFHIKKLRQQLLSDLVFATQMVKFIDWIIMNLIAMYPANLSNHLCEAPSALVDEWMRII